MTWKYMKHAWYIAVLKICQNSLTVMSVLKLGTFDEYDVLNTKVEWKPRKHDWA